ncbi:MAG: hypothetical protein PWP23_615 [Candidatus Sumerlaeota bacterium]|nr:hypothetical protein [Candidatus Sumerlaeota bacterium]
MPQLISLKFSRREMPRLFSPGRLTDLQVEEFVVAPREGTEDIGFIAAIEYVSTEQLKLRREPYASVVRRASDSEKEGFFVRRAREEKAMALCKEKAQALNLPMKITTVRLDPAETRYIYQFTSEQRVDFRALVRELSALLKARIELWQIGVRDEAKLVDGFGMCGLKLCCSTWLPDFRPINLRMAKDQDINLPPHKLSGLCGRLLCCLSYEVDQYKEMGRQLLSKGATIELEGKKGVIVDRNVINQSYLVQFEEAGLTPVKHAEITGEAKVPEQMKRMAKTFEEPAEGLGGKRTRQTPTDAPTNGESSEPEKSAQAKDGGRSKRRKRGGRSRSGRDAASRERAPNNATAPRPESAENAEEGEKKKRRRRSRRTRSSGEGASSARNGAPEGTERRSSPPGGDGSPRPPRAESGEGEKKEGRTGRKRRRSRRSNRGSGGGQKDSDPS